MKLVRDTRKKLEIKIANLIAKKIKEVQRSKDSVILGVPGGRSVSGIFTQLKKEKISWKNVHFFMIDERLVPTNHPDSNFKLAYDTILEYLVKQKKIPKENLHPYSYLNLGRKGLEAYKNELREVSPHFDIILLSSGEEGHIASLFPYHDSINNSSEFFIIVRNSSKPPSMRVSASRKLLLKTRTSILLFFGESKKKALEKFNKKSTTITECPAKIVEKIEDSYVFTDVK